MDKQESRRYRMQALRNPFASLDCLGHSRKSTKRRKMSTEQGFTNRLN